ncbi:MAG: hypothetical protein AAFQ17_08650 [Pseudomonadota bacterium]
MDQPPRGQVIEAPAFGYTIAFLEHALDDERLAVGGHGVQRPVVLRIGGPSERDRRE